MYQKNVTIKLCALIVICIFIAFPLLAGGTKPEEEAMERPAKAEVITITVWDQFGYEGLTAAGPAMDKLVEIYEERNPNIKIERTYVPQPNIRDQLRIAVSGGTEPHMWYTWPAAAVLASYARPGHIIDLTPAANRLGWFNKLPQLIINRNSYKGKLYAYPTEQDYMLIYYNKDIFREVGIQVPKTYKEFHSNCKKLKSAGYIPVAFGNRDKWPATNGLSYFFALMAGRELQEEVWFGDTLWNNPSYVEACKEFLDWVDRGYFPKGFNGIDFGEANSLFMMGDAAMNFTGTWMIEDFVNNATFDLGTFFLPQIKPDLPQATMMGEGSQWSISSRYPKDEQEECIKFLDFLMSEENYKIWIEEGSLVPIVKGGLNWDMFEVSQVIKETFINGDKMAQVNGYDLHTTTPESVTETLYNNLQLMLDKEITPVQFLKAMDDSWKKAKAADEIWVP
ncbi:MAG: hypothetical protein AMS17_00160 [Spirochaetes bacterium DG_61]|nr:MAG: hypothetical protein AMS17_00160 [Spirochaetes bacterium DG_61]